MRQVSGRLRVQEFVAARHGRRREAGGEPQGAAFRVTKPSPACSAPICFLFCVSLFVLRFPFEFLTRPVLPFAWNRSPSPDGELVELLWQHGAVVAHSQAQAHHHHHHRPLVQVGAGNTGASGVTGEPPALPWLPAGSGGAGAMGGDVYSQLWQSIAQADGRVSAPDAAGVARPPAKSGNSGAGSSRTAGEVGSSFCGSNLVAAALHLDDDNDIDDVGVKAAALPVPLDDPVARGGAAGARAGGSTSSGWNSNAVPKRSRDEFDEVVFLLCCSCRWVSDFIEFRFSS